jgi:hypothetical protein
MKLLLLLLSVISWSFSIQVNQIYAQERTTPSLFDDAPYSGLAIDSLLFYMEKAVVKDNKHKQLLKTAQKIHSNSIAFHQYVNTIRERMVEESGGAYTLEEALERGYPELMGKPKGKKDKETPQRIFVTGDYGKEEKKTPEGIIIAQKIRALKATYLSLIEQLWENKGIPNTVFENIEYKLVITSALKKELPLISDETWDATKYEGRSWEAFTFGGMPVAAIAPMLRKFQHDARYSEMLLLNLLVSQVEN